MVAGGKEIGKGAVSAFLLMIAAFLVAEVIGALIHAFIFKKLGWFSAEKK